MSHDREGDAAGDPRTPPHELADLAYRRWDLHVAIAANPGTYPELRHWIAQVNPNSIQQHPRWPAQTTPARSTGAGWWVAGCGCLALVGILLLVVVLGAVGARVSSDGDESRARQETSSPEGAAGDPVRDSHLKAFEADRAKYHALAARLEGNPVAPLVTDPVRFKRLEEAAKDPNLARFSASSLAQRAREYRLDVQKLVTAADKRRANRSGSIVEGLIDRAGDGFIDVRWDAASACRGSMREDWTTTACITKLDSLTIHFVPASTLSAWEQRMVTAHELAHVYQRADRRRFLEYRGHYDRLLKRGLFQGSDEKMADCYALTYYDTWTLSRGNTEIGYGYVCNKAERKAIRAWAKDINAPMPR